MNKIPGTLEFELGGEEVKIDLTDLTLSEATISKNLCNQAGKFAIVATYLARARAEVEGLSDSLKVLEAELDGYFRREMELAGTKITEGKVTAAIRAHTQYKDLQKDLSRGRLTEGLLGAIVQSYNHRKDCLLELARLSRAEMTNSGGASA